MNFVGTMSSVGIDVAGITYRDLYKTASIRTAVYLQKLRDLRIRSNILDFHTRHW